MSSHRTSLLSVCMAVCWLPTGGMLSAAQLDFGFDAGPRASGDIMAIATQPDGRIIVAGEFGTIQGTSRVGEVEGGGLN